MISLIINADDYGKNLATNKAIIESFRKGMISDTSILATCEDGFEDACRDEYMQVLDGKVGVHLSLTIGKPLTDRMKRCSYFCDENGFFRSNIPRNHCIVLPEYMKRIVSEEFNEQIKKVRAEGFEVTHLDSHQHIHYRLAILDVAIQSCLSNNISYIRICNTNKRRKWAKHVAEYVNRKIRKAGICTADFFGSWNMINSVPDTDKYIIREVFCHPVFNSQGQIADKVSRIITDECELLEQNVSTVPFRYQLTNYGRLKSGYE